MTKNGAYRPTRAEINLENLAFNFRSVKKFVGDRLSFMAVVKADAYGHGAARCARKLSAEGVDWFGVALPEEGLELRAGGIAEPILCLGGFWDGQAKMLLRERLTPVIYQIERAEQIDRAAAELGQTADVHVKIDTGMGRLGVRFDETASFAERLKVFPNLRVEGIMTHFAAADDASENEFTAAQIGRFYEAVRAFEEKGFRPVYRDLANSPGAVAHEKARGNLVRLGGVLYGLSDDVLPREAPRPELRPVMSFLTRISLVKRVPAGETLGYGRTFRTGRDSLIATVPVGYKDGYPRALSNKARVIVNGVPAPVVGRISMDWTIIDVTEVSDVKVNDAVVLIGEQDGLRIKAEDLAKLAETISYEITCGIDRRVVKKYTGS